MKIEVQNKDEKSLVCVVREGVCNHADAEEEQTITNYMYGEDVREVVAFVLTCQRCGAWYDEGYGIWEELCL